MNPWVPRAVALLGVAAMVVVLVVVLAVRTEPEIVGANDVKPSVFSVPGSGAEAICQPVLVPEGTEAVRFLAGTYGRPMPRVDVTVVDGSTPPPLRGTLRAGGPEGLVTVPVAGRRGDVGGTICVRPRTRERFVLAGERRGTADGARLSPSGRPVTGAIALTFLAAGEASWAEQADTVAPRVARSRLETGLGGRLGSALLPGVLLLVLLAVGAALSLALRAEARR